REPAPDSKPLSPILVEAAPDEAQGGRAVLDVLQGSARRILLARNLEALPAQAAPVLEIQVRGNIHLKRPPPLALRPGPEEWPVAGILLPCPLAELSP